MMRTKVVYIGKEAFFEDYPLIVLFGKDCPDELKDICILHDKIDEAKLDLLSKGRKIIIGENEYTIEEVGDSANKNFYNLGHITINFSPSLELMPGSILVCPYSRPEIKLEETIAFK